MRAINSRKIEVERIVICLLLIFQIMKSSAQIKPAKADTKGMAAYLMAYFKDETHSLYFAVSSLL